MMLAAALALALTASDPEAKDAFTAGEKAFAEDDYPYALKFFQQAFTLAPHDAVRFNIAVCLERIGRFREARAEYLAAAESPQLDAAAKQRARDQAARLFERLGFLEVTGGPAGAEVRVDGAALCTLPCRVEVDPTRHDVEVGGRKSSASVERGATAAVHFDAPSRGFRLGPLGWLGAATAVGSGIAIAVFGARAQSLHDQYVRMPTESARSQGVLMRDLANGFIAIASTAVVLALIDVLFLPHASP